MIIQMIHIVELAALYNPYQIRKIWEKFGIEFPTKGNTVIKNYLLLAMIDAEKGEILESALVKYERMEQSLKEALDKGKGSMVITA